MSISAAELLTTDLWEQLPIGVMVKNAQGTILWINDYGCELLKLHRDQVIGKFEIDSIWGVIHEDGSPFLPAEFPSNVALATGKPVRQVVMGINYIETIWLLVDSIPKLNEAGEVVGVICTFKDITAEKEAEKQRRMQAKRIQALVNTTFNGVVVLQGNRVIEANSRFAQMLGYSIPEVLQLTPKDWEPQITDSIKPVGADTQVYETIHYRKDGSTYHAEVAVSCLDIDGKDFYLCIVRDITHRKLTEAALKESREQFINIFRAVLDDVAYIDRDYVFRFVNNVMLARFDLTEEEVIDHTLEEIIGEELFQEIKPKFDECLQDKVVSFYQWVNYPRIGRRYMNLIYSPYRNREGKILGVVATSRDLTQQKITEDKLEAQRLQDRLIATIANELLKTFDYYAIFDITLPIVLDYLKCDRVVIYKFKSNGKAEIVRSVQAAGFESMLHSINEHQINAHVWEKDLVEKVTDIESANYSEKYLEFLRSHNIKSKMILGIWSNQKLWGAISVHQGKVRAWSDVESEFLCRISTQIGIAIYQSYLYKKTQTQLAQSNLLYRLSNFLKDTIDLPETFNYIVEQVGKLYPDSSVNILEFIPDRGVWQLQATYPQDYGEYHNIPHENNPISRMLLEGEIVAISDTKSLHDPINAEIAKTFGGAWLLVPICIDDRTWGCISVLRPHVTTWKEDTKLFLQTIADQITIALKKYRETTERLKAELDLIKANLTLEEMIFNRTNALMESQMLLRLQFEQEKLLGKISARIRDSLDINQVLQITTQEVRELIKCDRVVIYRILSDGRGEVVAESVRSGVLSLMGMKFSQEVFPADCYQAYLKGRIAVIKSPQETDAPCLREFMASLGVRAVITIGIVFDNLLWGLLILHHCNNDRDWQTTEISLVQKISIPLSVAIKQAVLYQRMEDQLKQWIELNHTLEAKLKEEQLLNLILERIRWSCNLNEILALVTTELRHFLQNDRVIILRTHGDDVIYGYQSPNDSPITLVDLHAVISQLRSDGYYQDSYKLILPIVTDTNPTWGLLIVYNHVPTKWNIAVIKLIKQITNQLGIAIEKATIQLKMENELRQKNALLKEVHHRVKNNLQIMSSLFRLQARKLDQRFNPAIEDAQSRIYAMALVHEQLYSSNNFDSLNMKEYVSKLVLTIFNTYNIQPGNIELEINIPKIDITLDKTIPIGLIVNELITNALKYAFPAGKGKIKIDVTKTEDSITLIVADNGVGLPIDFNIDKVNSLGMLLISDLTDQLGGKFTCHNDNGAVFTIVFPILTPGKKG